MGGGHCTIETTIDVEVARDGSEWLEYIYPVVYRVATKTILLCILKEKDEFGFVILSHLKFKSYWKRFLCQFCVVLTT